MNLSMLGLNGNAGQDGLKGFEVFTADDEKLGTICAILEPETKMADGAACDGHLLRVEPGMIQKLFGEEEDILVSESMIATVETDNGEVILNVTRDHLADGR